MTVRQERIKRVRARWSRWRIGMRQGWRRLMRLEGSPQAIAMGMAVGVLVAFSPTVGFQMIIAGFLAAALRANPAPAVAAVWITNPLTIPPIFAATYSLGRLFWPGRHIDIHAVLSRFVHDLSRLEFYELFSQFRELLELGVDVLVPMFIGGLIVGVAGGAVSYPITLALVTRARRLIEQGKQRLAQRRAEARAHRHSHYHLHLHDHHHSAPDADGARSDPPERP